jgi:hypothetical protein
LNNRQLGSLYTEDSEKLAIISNKKNTPRDCLESYSLRYEWTKTVRSVWPSIWCLPLIDDLMTLISKNSTDEVALIDVGASCGGHLKEYLRANKPNIKYYSFDVDRRTKQDFYIWDEVTQLFDIAVCSEVLEHLDLPEGLMMCEQILKHLKPNGKCIVTVPNIFHPTRFNQDPSHITPWCYDQLAGVMLSLGFDIYAIYRYGSFSPTSKRIKTRLAEFVASKLRPYLGIDSANSICIIAHRPSR